MTYLVQDVLDKARYALNDDAKVRQTDTALLSYFNDAILRVRNRRPDQFVGQWSSLPGNLIATNTFPLRDELVPAVADYIIGRAEAIDDEFVDDSRSAAFIAAFDKVIG
ncbi:MAG: hypothetical protein KGL39_33460 [Patescibacteria group bacterium]|nr:hypothetical protein [Patescibacteria group bacterium]